MGIDISVITVSDRCARGIREDRSGPLAAQLLGDAGFTVPPVLVVADEIPLIREAVRTAGIHSAVVLTTGGTGVAPRDVTPEAMDGLLVTELPGLAEALRRRGADAGVHSAVLSRGRAGLMLVGDRRVLVVNMPGSPGGVRDALSVLTGVIPHVLDQLAGGDH